MNRPILAGLAGQAFVSGGFAAALLAFAVAALALVLLLFVLALLVAAAQERTVSAIRASTAAVRRWGGRILVVVGVWFINLAIFVGFWENVFPV